MIRRQPRLSAYFLFILLSFTEITFYFVHPYCNVNEPILGLTLLFLAKQI